VRLNLLSAEAIPLSIWNPLSKMGASLANAPGFGAVLGVATGTREQEEAQKRAEMEADLSFWREIVEAHPDYKDAHLMVASFAYQLGENEEARVAASRALALDPNDQAAQDLRELLEKNTN
jgi:tetratricopeptide (TPR) repeat protein